MADITGKIYQMKNADGTENRFPRTVIEAVLGLSSYLQDQFSSLADIYMPIEGIYEALTGQEFVFRKSPNTIKAKSLTIDRIKGKTLAWNQLIPINGFSNITGDEGWGNISLTKNGDGSYTVVVSAELTVRAWFVFYGFWNGHKCYWNSNPSQNVLSVSEIYSTFNNQKQHSGVANTAATSTSYYIFFGVGTPAGTYTFKPEVIDLALAGIADEISAPADFKALYPGIYPYNPGTLKSNDAEAVETTGVNQWDEAAELGAIDQTTGGNILHLNVTRSTNYIDVFSSVVYYMKHNASLGVRLFYYDISKTLISSATVLSVSGTFTTPANCAYLRFQYADTTYNHDICINLSDPAINGQYFPYWKRTLQLGLNSFKVKDGNGNIITIAGGLKSAGSVYDEIVGNRYTRYVSTRAYQSGDENNSTVTTDGHGYTNYALATPIEYDLVEPLIYTMKAGTTESRISPNSDGLSAPFCCDITYSASENNDSESAQYAATAGRLLNSHKIWGQDFNGTGDITGELTGVTNLTASGIITGSRLVSTVATGTAPLTVASTTMVQNLVAEKASKLLTARTIWGQNFDGSGNISGAISNITTISASGLATISGGIALGTSIKAQEAKMVWDEINDAWHLQGNLYADGSISAKGTINDSSNYVTLAQYNALVARVETLEEQ